MLKATKQLKNAKGFTLIELLVVIGILTVLLAIVLIAINPVRQFKQANDTQRRSDVNAILNAVGAYAADNKGSLPGNLSTTNTATDISSTGVDLCTLVPNYIAALPADPNGGTSDCTAGHSYDTKYTIFSTNGRVTVSATPEVAASITVTR